MTPNEAFLINIELRNDLLQSENVVFEGNITWNFPYISFAQNICKYNCLWSNSPNDAQKMFLINPWGGQPLPPALRHDFHGAQGSKTNRSGSGAAHRALCRNGAADNALWRTFHGRRRSNTDRKKSKPNTDRSRTRIPPHTVRGAARTLPFRFCKSFAIFWAMFPRP